jgi:epoxyqueuosine reductase
MPAPATLVPTKLARQIKSWGKELGFNQVGIAGTDLPKDEARLNRWLADGYHGEMGYMARHGSKRSRPHELVPGTVRVIAARMDYQPVEQRSPNALLDDGRHAYIARYALGGDYHKVLRRRLQQLADRIADVAGPFGYRAFVDSGPVLEKPLARDAGLGWIGKHTNLINQDSGSWFLLGELLTDLPLPVDTPAKDHCGSCRACIDVCPTGAIVAPYLLDARRCISYLTIELRGSIPVEFRRAMGNRIFGCDDCQLICPWNKFARPTCEPAFAPRHGLDDVTMIELFGWSEAEWRQKTAGSAIRRAGYVGWLRNIAVALGNAPSSPTVVQALQARADDPSAVVREHVAWALAQHNVHGDTAA